MKKHKSIERPFKHGDNDTHYACEEMTKKYGALAECCGCTGHKCKDDYYEEKYKR